MACGPSSQSPLGVDLRPRVLSPVGAVMVAATAGGGHRTGREACEAQGQLEVPGTSASCWACIR